MATALVIFGPLARRAAREASNADGSRSAYGSKPLTVEVAEVRWTNATGFGLVFVHVHDEEHARLQRFIDWLKRTQNN